MLNKIFFSKFSLDLFLEMINEGEKGAHSFFIIRMGTTTPRFSNHISPIQSLYPQGVTYNLCPWALGRGVSTLKKFYMFLNYF